MLLPNAAHTLQRPHILQQIEQKFKGTQGIQTVVLLGIGGAGKTTLARQYLQTQKGPVVWDMNAETPEALLGSFEQLAFALSHTPEEKAEWERMKKTNNTQERRKKLLLFAQKKLKAYKQWYLLFDNVDNLTIIQDFFPHDLQAWGQGRILITTRNRHIRANGCIDPDHVVDVEHLSNQEKSDLFTKILNNSTNKPKEAHTVKQIQTFLKYIPPFPLDVLVAAHYVKNTRCSYDDYLKRIQSGDKELEESQTKLLHQMNNYQKTRYKIITSTLQDLLSAHPEYTELLLLRDQPKTGALFLIDPLALRQHCHYNTLEHWRDCHVTVCRHRHLSITDQAQIHEPHDR